MSETKLKEHRALWFDDALVVAGDARGEITESCKFNAVTGKLECDDIKPVLIQSGSGVAVLVPSDFCV